MKKKTELGLIDDHKIILDGILAMFENEPDYQFAFATTSAATVLDMLGKRAVDVLITDVMMPSVSGSELAREVRQRFPQVKILALSMNGQGLVIDELLNNADISGYVLKDEGKKELKAAIDKIANGGIYFSEAVLKELEQFSEQKRKTEQVHLSKREVEIIRLIEKEYSNRQIADTLFISEHTVETHRKNIFRKTDTSSVIGLVKYAYQHQLI